jgi:hypothetical protein
MSWFFDKDDPFARSMREYCRTLPREIPPDSQLARIPWNKGKTGLQTAWNKGKKMPKQSKETVEKRKALLTGRTLSDEHKRKIGEANSISKLGSIPWNKGKKIE